MSRAYKPSGVTMNQLRMGRFHTNYQAAVAKRAAAVASARARTGLAVPGITRTGGAAFRTYRNYGQQGEETHYNDCYSTTGSSQAGNIVAWTAVSPTAAAPDNPGGNSLFNIKQGTTKNTRLGNKLHAYAIRIKGQVYLPTTTLGDVIRVMLVRDKQANGATPAVNLVLEGNGAAGAATVNDYQNMDNIDRFVIVKDRRIVMNPQIGSASTSSTPFVKDFKMNHKCRTRIDYNSTTGAIGEIRSENYFMIVISEQGNTTTSITSRVYWKE